MSCFLNTFTGATIIPSAWYLPSSLLCSIPSWPSKLTSSRCLSSPNPLYFDSLHRTQPHRTGAICRVSLHYTLWPNFCSLSVCHPAGVPQTFAELKFKTPYPVISKVVGVGFPYASATPRKSVPQKLLGLQLFACYVRVAWKPLMTSDMLLSLCSQCSAHCLAQNNPRQEVNKQINWDIKVILDIS